MKKRMYWLLSVAFVIFVIVTFLAYPFIYPEIVSADDGVEQCVVFAKIGAVPLYRCIDQDYNIFCYINLQAAGVMTCMEY